jgi:hypothetical protein
MCHLKVRNYSIDFKIGIAIKRFHVDTKEWEGCSSRTDDWLPRPLTEMEIVF